ncbi:MAG: hypothetical protein GY856_44750 [bacterium]|nr:hypothetical protein [bacterium]
MLTISGKGSGPEHFVSTLRGIAIDGDDQLYAVGDSAVKVFDAQGKLLRHWRTGRPGHCVTVAGDGHVWIGEAEQLEIFDGAGELVDSWRDPELLGLVTAVGFTPDSVLVADARDRSIRRFDREGKFLHNIGKDNRMKGFQIPNGIVDFAVDDHDIIHAANPGKHRIERYTPEGELLGHFGRFDGIDPEGFPGCCNPTNLTVTGEGHVIVTEKAEPRAKILDAAGKLLTVVATDVFDLNCKNMDLAVDSQGRIYVVDTIRLAVFVFAAVSASGGVQP